jgi:N-acetyl-D-muramate 6-phosphate phosphatase
VIRVVLFDLDGTLVDTAPDLGHTLNEMRRSHGLAPLPDEVMRPQASHGARGLLKVGFGLDPGQHGFDVLREEFLEIYGRHLTRNSTLFPGMGRVLDALEQRDRVWGVVTNKPGRYTEPLLTHLGLLERAACVVSGDTCARPKPHPEPLLHACRTAGSPPGECLYVGDAARDIQAAAAAGMSSVVALYGYIAADERPQDWGAQGYINEPAHLLDYLGRGT